MCQPQRLFHFRERWVHFQHRILFTDHWYRVLIHSRVKFGLQVGHWLSQRKHVVVWGMIFINKLEYLSDRLLTNIVFYPDNFLCNSINVRSYIGFGGWRAAQSDIFVQKLWKIHRVEKGDIAWAVFVHRIAIFLHDHEKRFLQLQKLLNQLRNHSCSRTSSVIFQPKETFWLIKLTI